MGARKKKVKKTTPARKLPPRGRDGRFKSKKQKPGLLGSALDALRKVLDTPPGKRPKPKQKPKQKQKKKPKPKGPARGKDGRFKAKKKKKKPPGDGDDGGGGGWWSPPEAAPSWRQESAFLRAEADRIDELNHKEQTGQLLSVDDAVLAKMVEADSKGALDQIIRDIIASGDWGDYESDELYDLFYGYGDD